MFVEANRALVELAIIFAFVVIICTSFIFEFFDKILINVVFVASTIKTLSKLAIA